MCILLVFLNISGDQEIRQKTSNAKNMDLQMPISFSCGCCALLFEVDHKKQKQPILFFKTWQSWYQHICTLIWWFRDFVAQNASIEQKRHCNPVLVWLEQCPYTPCHWIWFSQVCFQEVTTQNTWKRTANPEFNEKSATNFAFKTLTEILER